MKFYLVYKNHGLYDPILDDSEDIYVPIGPNDLDQEPNVQELRQVQIETKESLENTETETEYSILAPSKPYRPISAGTLEEPANLNLYYQGVFPELSLEDLPPEVKYKLPVSEQYDPEGKRVKHNGIFDKKIIVDFDKIKKLAAQKDVIHTEEVTFKKDVSDKSFFEKKEKVQVGKDEYKHLNILEEESDLRKVKKTAKQIIEDSLSKAVSVADQLKYKSDFKLESSQYDENKALSKLQKLSKSSFEKSNSEKVKLIKKVSFEDDYKIQDEEISSNEASKREVHVADEIKKFESFAIQMDSTLNAEERKLLTQQDIEEAIEAGTVRQRTDMFKTGTQNIIKTEKLDKKTVDTIKSEIKTNIELSKQKVYNIGLQVIPHIRATVQSSRQSTMLLKRFLLQMTKVMITLYKLIPAEKRYNFWKSKRFYEETEDSREYIHKIDYNDGAFRGDTCRDGVEEIRKSKLSGAKIAQIQGLKPAELTDRMNIVISEFLRKSGMEEERLDDKGSHRSQTSTSESESRKKDDFSDDTSFTENNYNQSQTGEEFLYSSSFKENDDSDGTSFRENDFDKKKLFQEMYETKTQSYEIREMKEEKRSFESKYESKKPSYESESTSRDDVTVPLTYIAIVEAHVYTNKNAIFEEQMRRMSESINQSDIKEADIIYYRCEVSVFYRQFREPSLPPTVVIESIEEIPSEQVLEEENIELLQTCETSYENIAKKLAVQKISEVIEPLLTIKEVKSINIKQAYPAIETPLRSMSEQTTLAMEKEENILQESKSIVNSLVSIEKPVKSVVEISEIKEEERSALIELISTEELKPRPILEPSQAIAETTEIFIEEETVGMVDVPQPIVQLPQPAKVEKAIKSVAETSEVTVDEANLEILDVSKTITAIPRYTIANNLHLIAETMIAIIEEPKSENKDELKITGEKVKVGVDEIIASEVFEVFPEEPIYEEVILTETKRRQSEVFLEKSLLVLPEITLTSVEEPTYEELIISKAQSKEAKVDVSAKVVAEITEVSISEKEQDTFEVVKINAKEPGALKERSVLSVGETETILPFEPPAEPFDSSKVIKQQAFILIEESKAIETTVTQIEEPKEKNIEVLEFLEKSAQAFIEDNYLIVAETLSTLPEEPKEIFEINEILKQQAHVEVEELKTASVSSVTVEEPKQEIVDTHKVNDKEANTDIEASLLTVAKNTIILPDGPHHGNFEIPQVETKRAKTLIEGGLTIAETILVSSSSPEEDFIVIEKNNEQANIRIEKSKAITTSLVQLEEPREEKFDVLQFLEKQTQVLLQDSLLPVATRVEIIPEGPKYENFVTSKTVEEKAHIDIEEIKTASVTVVSVEEPKNEIVENFTYKVEQSEFILEKPVLNVVETFTIMPEGPLSDRLETLAKKGDTANIIVEEIKPLAISIITPNEPQEKAVDVPKIKHLKPQSLIEDRFLPVVETISVVPDEPKDSFNVVSVRSEQADVKIGELKGTSITVVYSEEPREENLKLPIIEVKQQKPVLETVYLTTAETSLLLSEEPKINFNVTQTISQQANIKVIEQKVAESSLVFPLESRDKDLVVQEIIDKTPKTLLESPVLTAAQNSVIVFEEKVEELPETTEPVSQKATIYLEEQKYGKIGELKGTSITVVYSEGPREVNLNLPIIEVKQQHPILEAVHLTAAETSLLLLEESKISFDVTQTTSQQAHVEVIEQKAAKGSIVFSLESRDKDLLIQEIIEKTPKTLLESPVLTAAQNSVIISEEKVEEIPETTKPVIQKALLHLEGLKLPNTIILLSEEPKPVIIEGKKIDKKEFPPTLVTAVYFVAVVTAIQTSEIEKEFTIFSKSISKKCKLTCEAYSPVFHTTIIVYEDAANYTSKISKLDIQAKTILVESTATAVAKSTFVNVTIAKEEIVDVSKYIVELAEEQVENEAALKVTKEITVDIKDIDLSSASSTISSAPSSPFIQEYVFGVATGHEYRIQSPQETELHIVQPAKDLYGVDTADTSYTLTFEAAYEEEKEILQMEEFGNVVKKNQFWISDVKTMETVKSSDAKMQLINIGMGIEARKANQYVSVQDAPVEIKSRSPSFDTSADFEVSLQSSKQLEARETQISEVQAVATIDLKSEVSFKTIEDVESQAKVNIKSKSAKAYSAQSVDIAYGLTIGNEIVVDGQSMEIDCQTSLESKSAIAKSTKKKVIKDVKAVSLETSETSFDYEVGINHNSRNISKDSYGATIEGSLETRSISKETYGAIEGSLESRNTSKKSYGAVMERSLETKSISKESYGAIDGSLESRSIAKEGFTKMNANLESSRVSEANYLAIEGKLESSGVSTTGYAEMDASLESRSISESSYAAVEANLESSIISGGSYSSKQMSLASKSFKSMEMDAIQKMSIQKGVIEITQGGTKLDGQHKLSLQTDLKEIKTQGVYGVKSPSPEEIPSPLRDEYIFRLHTPAPEETAFIPRDCSFTPESDGGDEIVIVNGMIPHIDTKIVRILYSPPLETPPMSPIRKAEHVFAKPGLRGGSETPESIKLGFKSGSHTPEFTKEDLLEMNRKSALLASAIDKTIRSIEEYKESVGIGTKTVTADREEEERLNEDENTVENTKKSFKNDIVKLEKVGRTRKSDENKKVKCLDAEKSIRKEGELTTKSKIINTDKSTELDVRKEENNKFRKTSMLSKFSQI